MGDAIMYRARNFGADRLRRKLFLLDALNNAEVEAAVLRTQLGAERRIGNMLRQEIAKLKDNQKREEKQGE